ncbi:hypothetical protein CRUP_019058 [Coryphaenoides rupestris]|nr:hypothetical protein CRUP_019058 [Coryphaenoides rupestris]
MGGDPLHPMCSRHVFAHASRVVQAGVLQGRSPDRVAGCQHFLKRCLTKPPLGRPPLEHLLLHPWLQ